MKPKLTDPILLAVMREIHKTAEKPAKGFYTVEDWAKRWGRKHSQARLYVRKAIRLGIMVKQFFRISTRKRSTYNPILVAHYGPTPKKKPRKRSV